MPRAIEMVVLAVVVAGATVASATADEAKTPVTASMLLNVLTAPFESREAAYDRSLKEEGPAPRAAFVVQPDGTIRYGSGNASVSVTVKNPCPPGTIHYEPPPLPGRRPRN